MFNKQFRSICLISCLIIALTAGSCRLLAQRIRVHPETRALLNRGDLAERGHDFDEALRQFGEALTKARALADKSGEAEALSSAGIVYMATGRPQKSLEFDLQALTAAREAKDRPREASALNNIGTVYGYIGQPERAMLYYLQALPVFQETKNRAAEAAIRQNIGDTYNHLGQPDRALAELEQALAQFREIKKPLGEAKVMDSLGIVYSRISQPLRALDYYGRALVLFREGKDTRREAGVLLNLGNVHNDIGEPYRALAYLLQALPLYRDVKHRKGEARTLVCIGIAYSRLGQARTALGYYEQALPLLKEIGDNPGEAATLSNIAAAYNSFRQPQKSLTFSRRALVLHQQNKDKRGEAHTQLSIGSSLMDAGQPKQALQPYRQALALFQEIKSERGEAGALENLATAQADAGQADKGLALYRRSLAMFRDMHNIAGEASVLGNMAGSEKSLGQHDLAERHVRNSLDLLEGVRARLGGISAAKIGFLQSHLDTYYLAMDLLIQRGKPADAFAVAQQTKARALLDVLEEGKVTVAPRVTADEKQKELELRREAELLNTRMVAEGVRNEVGAKKRFAALKVQIARAEDALQAFTAGLFARYPELARKRVARTATLADVARFLPPDTALLEYVVLKGEKDYVVVQDESKVEKRDRTVLFVVTRRSASATALVRVYSMPLGHTALARRVDAFRAACADPRKAYAKQANALYRLLVAPAANQLAGKRRLLICPDGPLWDLPFAALTSSRAHTQRVPATALRGGEGSKGKAQFLAERFEIDYAYSATGAQASLLAKTDERRTRPTRTLLALANPDFGDEKRFGDTPGLPGQRPIDAPSRPIDAPSRPISKPSRPIDAPSRPMERPSRPIDAPSRPIDKPSRPIDAPSRPILAPSRPLDAPSRTMEFVLRDVMVPRGGHIVGLPGTQREADALARRFPDAAIYTGKQAQEQIFKEKAAGFRYIHLASHAFFNDAAPLLSSIVLADPPPGSPDDGFLTAREIFDLDLSAADLVVLSACNTARGENRTGEGLIGLTWALFVAGAPTQVVSQWSVDDASTAMLMEDFYARLKRGEAKGTALREASMSQIRGENRKSGYPAGVIQNRKYSHPYYWAPFILIGDWRR